MKSLFEPCTSWTKATALDTRTEIRFTNLLRAKLTAEEDSSAEKWDALNSASLEIIQAWCLFTDFWFCGFCTVYKVDFLTTFRQSLLVPKRRQEIYLTHRAKSPKPKISIHSRWKSKIMMFFVCLFVCLFAYPAQIGWAAEPVPAVVWILWAVVPDHQSFSCMELLSRKGSQMCDAAVNNDVGKELCRQKKRKKTSLFLLSFLSLFSVSPLLPH